VRQKYFIKATLNGGMSGYDPNFKYHLGENIHPNPDRKNTNACGLGIHLARDITFSKTYVPSATEFYLAVPSGDILGSDEDKIRVDKCNLLCQIPPDLIQAYAKVTASAWEAYKKAEASAWEAYEKARAPAREAYEKARAPAREAFKKATAPAYQKLIRNTLQGLKSAEGETDGK